jgi:hypothetical protein
MSKPLLVRFHIEDENLLRTLIKQELSNAVNSLAILEKHAIIIYDIALWIWKTKSYLVNMPVFIDFFMKNPKENYKLYRNDVDEFMLLLG